METNHLKVFDVESKDNLSPEIVDVPWNAAGTATTWDVRWRSHTKPFVPGPFQMII